MGKSLLLIVVGCIALTSAATAFAADPPSADRFIILARPHEDQIDKIPPILERELLRQAILLAARDDIGLWTRDAVLGEESPPGVPNAESRKLDLDIQNSDAGKSLSLNIKSADGKSQSLNVPISPLHSDDYPDAFIPDLTKLTIKAEQLSRLTFPAWLKDAGFGDARTKPIARDETIPKELETRLTELTIFSQYAAVRTAHETIAAHGPSRAMLQVLARGYANLGQLTRIHWTGSSDVFTARSLLYAQRLVNSNPNLAINRWTRAYALAMAGLHSAAITDLDSMKGTDGAPPWVDMLDAMCHYDITKLQDLAGEGNPQYMLLGEFMAFLNAESSNNPTLITQTVRPITEAMPYCERIENSISAVVAQNIQNGDFRFLTQLTFTQDLLKQESNRDSALPASAAATVQAVSSINVVMERSFRIDGGGFGDSEAVSNAFSKIADVATALINAPEPAEPSWSVLGKLLLETNTVSAYKELATSDGMQGKALLVLAAGHPFSPLIDALFDQRNKQPLPASLRDIPFTDATFRYPFDAATLKLLNAGRPDENALWNSQAARFNPTAWDCERYLLSDLKDNYDWKNADQHTIWLRTISPYSTIGPVKMLEAGSIGGDPQQALTDMVKKFGNQVGFKESLTTFFMNHEQYDKAAYLLQITAQQTKSIADYRKLANCYLYMKDEDHWLATLQDCLKLDATPFQNDNTQAIIAEHLMSQAKYKEAMEYADAAAADSNSPAAILSDAKCHGGAGDWDGADKLMQQYIAKMPSISPVVYYEWCRETGHGNIEQAKLDSQQSVQNTPPNRKTAFFDLGEGDIDGEHQVVQGLYDANHNAFVGLWLISLDDAAGDDAGVDAILSDYQQPGKIMSAAGDNNDYRLCADCIRSIRESKTPADAQAAVDKLSKQIRYHDPTLQSQIRYFLGEYRIRHGPNPDDGWNDLIYCSLNHTIVSDAGFMARLELQKHGVDPWNPASATTQPTTQPAH